MDVSAEPMESSDEQLVRQLVDRARAEGLRLTGEGGLLGRLTKVVVESALEGEMDDHLGYGKHNPAGRNGGNSRNGARPKTLVTEAGPVDIEVPRDREGNVANRPIYVALAVTVEGHRDILGRWAGEHGNGEGYGTSTCSFPPVRAAA